MELNRTIKQGLSILQAQISDQSDYILITNEKAVSKHKVFTKTDGGWEDITNTCEPSDILSDVGLNKSEEVNLIKNENMILKKKIDELNSKILQLEEEEEEEEAEEEVVIKKKKKSGKSASQEKIKDDIIKYINNNRITDDDSLPEDFNDFSVTMDENDSDRIKTLKNIFDKMAGSASESVYRSFIELELLHKLYLKKFGNKMGKNLAREDLSRIITTKKKPSAYFRKASRFYFICKHLKKGVWKECALAPTYWESINSTTWDSILENLNTENLSEEENSE